MKKILFTLFAFAIFGGNAWGQSSSPRVYIDPDPAEVMTGGEGVINICVDRAGEELRDLQLDITLPDGFEFVRERVSDNQIHVVNNENEKPSLQGNDQGANGKTRRFIMFSFGGLLMNDGPVLEITIKNTSAFDLDSKHTAKAKNVILSANLNASQSSQSGAHQIDYAPFDIDIQIVDTYVLLDEESETYPITEEVTDHVWVKRSLKADIWNTICLPFDMNPDMLNAVFKSTDWQLATIGQGAVLDVNDDGFITNITLRFASKKDEGIKANTAYIIKVPNDIDHNTGIRPAAKVTIKPQANGLCSFNKGLTNSYTNNKTTFYGLLRKSNVSGNNDSPILYLSNNKFYYLGTDQGAATFKGFRGYFTISKLSEYLFPESEEEEGINVNIFVDDEQVTNIDGYEIVSKPHIEDGVYDLQGRKVKVENGDLSTLQKGIYIVNGKKITVK